MSAPAVTTRPAHPFWRRDDIQGLRAIAVLLVVAYHGGLPVPGGFVGVDVFFVISGFVITQLILRNHASPDGFRFRTFYARRMKRLLPALALMVTVTLIAAIFLLSPFGPQRTTATTALGASFFVANVAIYFNTGGYFDAPAAANPLLHTWSLSVEEQFYFIFPALMVFAWWRANKEHADGRRIAATILSVISLVSLALSVLLSFDLIAIPGIGNTTSWAFYSSAARAWEFGVGALLAMGLAHWPGHITKARGNALTIMGALIIVGSAAFVSDTLPFPGLVAIIPVLGTALVMAGGSTDPAHPSDTTHQPPVSRALAIPAMVWLGALSYSWYLWHWPVIVYAKSIWPDVPGITLIAAALSLVPAWLAYRFVENPVRENPRIVGRRIGALIATVIAIPSLLAVLVIVGAQAHWGNRAIEDMARQIDPLPVSYNHGCDSGRPLGQQDGLNCTWPASGPQGGSGVPISLVGDSQAGQLAEAVIGAGTALHRPVQIADMDSCPFLLTAPGEPTLSAPDCQAYVQATVAALTEQDPGTVVIGVSPNYITEDTKAAVQAAVLRPIEQLTAAGQRVVLLAPIPQFPEWSPTTCSVLKAATNANGCGTGVARATMDERQQAALDVFRAVAAHTGATVLDVRDALCPDGQCVTNVADTWLFRDLFHITVGESERLTPQVTDAIMKAGAQ